jgi:hypothetical protein
MAFVLCRYVFIIWILNTGITYLKNIFHVKIQLFKTVKSHQDPDPDGSAFKQTVWYCQYFLGALLVFLIHQHILGFFIVNTGTFQPISGYYPNISKFVSIIQCFGSRFIEFESGSNILGWIPIRLRIRIMIQFGSRVEINKIWRKNLQLKKNFHIFLIKNRNLLIPWPP